MIYQVTTSGLKKERQNTDNSSILRIYNVGDYPVKIRINGGSFYDPIIRNQHIDITRTATPVEFVAIGGDTAIRTYRVYGDNIDECDIDGILDYDNVTITDEYGEKKFVQLKSIAQDLNSPDQGTIPSTKAVYNSIEETLSKIGKVLVFRGTVTTFDDLPDNALYGDTYNVVERHDIYGPGTNYAWDGSKWDALGSAALDVQAEENFKDLVSQSTSEFEKTVENATAQKKTQVYDAKGLSEAAYTHAQDAYIYRGEAEYFATKAEAKVQEASAIKDQVEDALSKAEEIVDLERLGDSIEELQRSLVMGLQKYVEVEEPEEEELEILAAEKELSELDAQFDGDTILDAALAESMQIEDASGETLDVDDGLSLDDADLDDDMLDVKDDFSDDMDDFEE